MARLLLIVLLGITGCAPSIPREQVERANAAYEAVAARSEPVLADLSIAERRLFISNLVIAKAPQDGDIVVPIKFDPATAGFSSTIGDPLLTAALRRGLALTGDYFKLLVMLAEGRNIDEVKDQISALATSIAGIISVATEGAALPIAAVAKELGPLIDQWAQAKNAEELRRLVLEGEPVIKAQIKALRDASTAIYEILTREPMRAARTTLADNPTARHAAFVRMTVAHIAVADYVVLLDKLNDALSALVAAVRNPASPVALASLSATADSVLIQARAAAGAIAIIKSGSAP